MIITEFVEIKTLRSKNLDEYQKFGYDTSLKTILVKPEHLPKSSRALIKAKCKCCNCVIDISYRKYFASISKGGFFTCSSECAKEKRKITNLKKYGTEYISQSNKIKEKVKETNLKKYGCENVFSSNEIKNKIKKSNLEKYGFESASKSEIIKEKIINSNIKRYGGLGFGSIEINKKIQDTNLFKYGFEFASKSEIIKERLIENNIEKYGVNDIQKNEKFRKNNYEIAKNINYIKYIGNRISLFSCDLKKDHKFEIHKDNYYNRLVDGNPLCTICYPISEQNSLKEIELLEFIKSIYSSIILPGYRDILEIDIYLIDLKLGFEFNGLYWHSEEYKDKDYHLNKLNWFKKKGIHIINIWEDDWNLKKDIIKSQIKNYLGLTENKIMARKCVIKEVKDSNFLNENHIQGNVASVVKLGLFYNDVLVSLMTFDNFEGRKKMEIGGWNLSRFCNKLNTSVIGGASKLLSYFIKKYRPLRIISYADKSWSQGNLYYTLGFKLVSETQPDYKYIINGIRENKTSYKKSKLIKEGFTGTEKQIMENLGYNRIYDCGKMKFEINL